MPSRLPYGNPADRTPDLFCPSWGDSSGASIEDEKIKNPENLHCNTRYFPEAYEFFLFPETPLPTARPG